MLSAEISAELLGFGDLLRIVSLSPFASELVQEHLAHLSCSISIPRRLVYAPKCPLQNRCNRLDVEERLELTNGVLGAGNRVSDGCLRSVDLVIISACSTRGQRRANRRREEGRGGKQEALTLVSLVAKEVDLLEVLLRSVRMGRRSRGQRKTLVVRREKSERRSRWSRVSLSPAREERKQSHLGNMLESVSLVPSVGAVVKRSERACLTSVEPLRRRGPKLTRHRRISVLRSSR
jgi:hypothetical protein